MDHPNAFLTVPVPCNSIPIDPASIMVEIKSNQLELTFVHPSDPTLSTVMPTSCATSLPPPSLLSSSPALTTLVSSACTFTPKPASYADITSIPSSSESQSHFHSFHPVTPTAPVEPA